MTLFKLRNETQNKNLDFNNYSFGRDKWAILQSCGLAFSIDVFEGNFLSGLLLSACNFPFRLKYYLKET